MKKKLALFLAVIMVMALLPMNLFGARPGTVLRTLPSHPIDAITRGNAGENRAYTFRIDAAALSQIGELDGTSILEFTLEGGADGEVGFVMPWGRTGYPAGSAHTVRYYGRQTDDGWVDVVAAPAPSAANPGGGWTTTPSGLTFIGAGAPNHHIRWGATPFAANGPSFEFAAGSGFGVDGNRGANHADVQRFITWLNNTVSVNREYPARPSGTASDAFYNRPGSNGWSWRGAPINDNNDHPAPHNVFLRRMSLVLTGRGSDAQLPVLEGWLYVTVHGVRAASDEAAMTIMLRESRPGMGLRSTTLLSEQDLNVTWHNGVNISSVSIVPMEAFATLSGIRIREDRLGGILSSVPGEENQETYVRLVAPRGFRWDAGWLRADDIGEFDRRVTGRAFVTGNAAFANQTRYGFEVEVVEDMILRDQNGNIRPNAIPRGQFMNENTNRNELILRITTSPRGVTFAAETTPAEMTIHGLNLIPVRGAATTGNVAIDVYVAGPGADANYGPQPSGDHAGGMERWGIGRPWHLDSLRSQEAIRAAHRAMEYNNNPASPFNRGNVHGAPWAQHDEGGQHWRVRNLIVATFDFEGDIEISGPANVQTVRSGEWSTEHRWTTPYGAEGYRAGHLTFDTDNADRFLNGNNHTIRIQEVVHGSLFRSRDRFEIVPENEGLRIVDARFRAGRTGEVASLFSWGPFDRDEGAYFIGSVGSFEDDGAIEFFPRMFESDQESRIRHLDIGLAISVEAGFEQRYGTEARFRIYRNAIHLGTVTVADVYDPIRVASGTPAQITRNAFDVLRLTPVAPFTIYEAQPGELGHGYELRFALQAVQGGREVDIRMGDMELWLSEPVVNTNASGFELRELPGGRLGFRVHNVSYETAAVIQFNEVFLAGPTVPGIEWHVVVYGPEISANSHHILGDTDFIYGDFSRRTFGVGAGSPTGWAEATNDLPFVIRHGRFYRMPYNTEVLQVLGLQIPEQDGPIGIPEGPGQQQQQQQTRTFTRYTLVPIEGQGNVQAIIFDNIAPGYVAAMMNPRVFADFIGVVPDWNEATRSVTFSGTDRHGVTQTVVLTIDQPTAMVNGQPRDIATGAGHPQHAGLTRPVIQNERMFVPARFLAVTFGLPITGDGSTVTLG